MACFCKPKVRDWHHAKSPLWVCDTSWICIILVLNGGEDGKALHWLDDCPSTWMVMCGKLLLASRPLIPRTSQKDRIILSTCDVWSFVTQRRHRDCVTAGRPACYRSSVITPWITRNQPFAYMFFPDPNSLVRMILDAKCNNYTSHISTNFKRLRLANYIIHFFTLLGIFMPPYRRCRRHYVSGLSVRPDFRPDLRPNFFVYAITQVLLDGISSNLVQGCTTRSRWTD